MDQIDNFEQLNKYRIMDEIGRGGFATVYRAHDTVLERDVAVKVLDPILARDDAFIRRFWREAKLAASLRHPHIVTVLDVGEANGRFYIVMELLPGRTLKQIIASEGPQPLAQIATITRQIAAALDYAHLNNLIHRDIKSSNIMLDEEGQATLMDFGIVRALEGTQFTTSLGHLGTPEYMAPEVLEGETPLAASDLYALGIVIYELTTGQLPFTGTTPLAVIRAQADRQPNSPQALRPDLPPAYTKAVLRSLAKQPEERYPDGAALAKALESAVTDATSAPKSVAGKLADQLRSPSALSLRQLRIPRVIWLAAAFCLCLILLWGSYVTWDSINSQAIASPSPAALVSSPLHDDSATSLTPTVSPQAPITPLITQSPLGLVDVIDTSEQTRTPTSTATATSTPTSTATASSTPTLTLTTQGTGSLMSETATPTLIPIQILEPPDRGQYGSHVTFRWQGPNIANDPNRHYEIRLYDPTTSGHRSLGWVEAREMIWLPDVSGAFEWAVALVRGRDGRWEADIAVSPRRTIFLVANTQTVTPTPSPYPGP